MRGIAMSLLAVAGLATTAIAQPNVGGTITDGGASFTIDLGSNTGPLGGGATTSLFAPGFPGQNQLPAAWWWMRVDGVDNREFAVHRPAAQSALTFPAGNQMQIVYNYGTFTLTMRWTINEDGPGSATLTQTLRIRNNDTANGYTVNLFNYNNIDVFGTPGNDSAVQTGPNSVTFFDGIYPVVQTAYEGANLILVDTNPNVLGRLTNNVIDNMTGGVVSGGPDDLEAATQFIFNLAPGGVQTVSATLTIVPTPAAAGILGLGGLLAARRRRR
jgi:hypothetical protein